MNTARVMHNGDLRLPAEVAERLNMQPGDALGIETEPDGTVRLFPKRFTQEEVFGCLASKTVIKATIEEMDEAIAEAFLRDER